jgi:hypothetical protein
MGRGALIAVVVSLSSAAPASANPSGQITRATTNAEGTLGSFAGSATYDGSGCVSAPATTCPWIAIMTVQPANIAPPRYPCNSDNWSYGGNPSVRVIWSSGAQAAYGTVVFDREDFPILGGVTDQRLCLYLGYQSASPHSNYTCADPDPYCPPGVSEEQFDIVGSAVFSVEPSTGGGGSGGGGGGSGGGGSGGSPPASTQQAPRVVLSKALAVSKAKAALSKKYGRAYKRGRRRLSCNRRSSQVYACSFTLRYRKKKRSGTVTVRTTTAGIKTTIKSH